MQLIQILLTLARYIPEIVKVIEQLFPNAPGRVKLDAAVKVVAGIVAAVPEAEAHADAIKQHVVPLINLAVGVLNSAGVFKSGEQQAGG